MITGSSDCLSLSLSCFILAQTFFPAHAFIFVLVLFACVLSQHTPSSFKVFGKLNYSFDLVMRKRRILEPTTHSHIHPQGADPRLWFL
ncbi:hypothetical protein HZ326_1729 [Fusarium oxysporum f. sp. albedinis]|nr:hypothetical protein HZ326_1729 [Fusarium oxysporum f. sp. albedinis]